MQVTNYVTRGYATLGPSELQPPFTRAYVRGSPCGSPPSLTFWHWAGVSTYTSSCEFAGTCVLDKQSPGPIFCSLDQTIYCYTGARPHLSRSYVVNLPSSLIWSGPYLLVHLYQSACVSLRYGCICITTLRSFSWALNSSTPPVLKQALASQLV